MKVQLTVNGEERSDDVEPRLLLVHYLREMLGLRAANVGCDTTSCGACTVLLNGESVKSCTVLTMQADGQDVTTAEGLARDGELHPVQAAFRQEHGLQCGFCTPGMVMAATGLLAENPHPTETEVREGLEGNFCRCTGYHNIVRAVLAAADMMSSSPEVAQVIPAPFDYARADVGRARAGPAGRARRRGQAAGRRPLAAADDEAAARHSLGADRHRRAGRAGWHRHRRRRPGDRGHHPARRRGRLRAGPRPGAAAGLVRGPGRRPADPPPRHDRRLARARRPGGRPAPGADRAGRLGGADRAGREPDRAGGRLLHGVLRDGDGAGRDAHRGPGPPAPGRALGLPEVHPPGQRLGHRRRRRRGRPGGAGQHGRHRRCGPRRWKRRWPPGLAWRRRPRWPPKAPSPARTSTPTGSTGSTWPASSPSGRYSTRPADPPASQRVQVRP